jgi:transaldolase
MKFFIDTALLDEIHEAHDMGVLDGVTTNPSLMRKAGVRDFNAHIHAICEAVDGGDVSAEVISTKYDDIMAEAHDVAAIHENVVVKVPLILDGIKAIRSLDEEGIRTNCTLCFSPSQALIAAKAGAAYISPFVGRIDDTSWNGMDLVRSIVAIYDSYGFETEVLAASLRHPLHVVEAAEAGSDVATMPLEVIKALVKHPLTDVGLKKFLDDWDTLQAEIAGDTKKAPAGGDGASH